LQSSNKTEQAFLLEKQVMTLLAQQTEVFPEEGQKTIFFDKAELIQTLQEAFADEEIPHEVLVTKDSSINNEMKALLDSLISQISKGDTSDASVKELFSFLLKETEQGHLPKEILNKLFEKEPVTDLVGKALEEQWLLKPQDVEIGKNISEFYQRLQQHISTLSATAAEVMSASQTLTQALAQMKENVDFLNQLSQMIPYVQLPLKLNGQSATGDLYVFADKKSLTEKGENITAALHLDMQYLGHLDVFVKLVSSKVETDFKVESDDTLQFLSDHIEILNERLQKRGYDLTVNLDKMTEPAGIKHDLMQGSSADSVEKEPIAYYRLDVRA
ncbi:MAG: flagellar hook-length control protein FliK, partial [Lachnospiraceae bacterium]|nr:flagellar hook-length control protein FliK [Lachnospiraceae bacterium]